MGQMTFARLAAATTEQVISATRARLYAVLPDVASTAGTVTLRNAPAAEKVGTPGTVAGTPSDTGGSLTNAHGPYYAKIQAVDAHGELSLGSTEQSDTIASGTAGSIVYTWVAGTGATPTYYRIYVGDASGVFDRYFTVAGSVLTYTLTALTGGTAWAAADTVATATSGTAKIVSHSALALLAAGKHFHGVTCDRGIVAQLSNTADLGTVIYENF